MPFNPSAYNNADAAAGDQPPPYGSYEVEVIEAGAFLSKDDRALCKIMWRVLAGTQIGVCWTTIGSLEEKGLFYTKGRLQALGFDVTRPVEDIYELDDNLARELKGVQAVVKVEPGQGAYVNTEVLRRISRDERPQPEGVSSDIPVPTNGHATDAVPAVEEDNDPIPF